MNKEEFEKKYSDIFNIIHLRMIIPTFQKDLEDLLKYECQWAIDKFIRPSGEEPSSNK